MSLLAGDEARVGKFFGDEAILKDSDNFAKFIEIISALDSLAFVLSDDYEDQHEI